MYACGEGSYGRLGQGNSDDLHTLTAISALQGYVIFVCRIGGGGANPKKDNPPL